MIAKLYMRLVQRFISVRRWKNINANDVESKEELKVTLPPDVKEGHFAVLAMKSEEPKRFVLELSNLSNPAFLRLLEQAEEEYGEKQTGVLAIPCQPEELEKILQDSRKTRSGDARQWSAFCP